MAKPRIGGMVDGAQLRSLRGHGFDPWHTFVEAVPMLVDRARIIREDEDETMSYRIRVGCMAVATSADGSEIGMFGGGNTKPTKAHGKVCAETRTIRRARRVGMLNIVGLVVIGDPQPDDGSGVASPTLHCCEECRVNNLEKLCNDDTIIMTVQPEADRFQVHTAREIIEHHQAVVEGSPSSEQPLYIDDGFRRWERSRSLYGEILRDNGITDVGAMIEGSVRETVVSAARHAITGAPPLT